MIAEQDMDILRAALEACDHAATANVEAGRGGPFAASLHLYDGRAWHIIAGPVGNAVLETGLGSAHAEDRVIQPDHIAALIAGLKACAPGAARVAVVSSAESCPACHAKLEILARTLVADGVLAAGRFVVLYGASYEDTATVAGFNDSLYQDDFMCPAAQRMIPHHHAATLPAGHPGSAAAVEQGGRWFRGDGAHPESVAIHAACIAQKEAGRAEPWNLGGATLYTDTDIIGPLTYAEAQWANIGRIVSTGNATRTEAPGIGNADLFEIIATRPYPHPRSALSLIRLCPFANRAQHAWRGHVDRGEAFFYNGAGAPHGS